MHCWAVFLNKSTLLYNTDISAYLDLKRMGELVFSPQCSIGSELALIITILSLVSLVLFFIFLNKMSKKVFLCCVQKVAAFPQNTQTHIKKKKKVLINLQQNRFFLPYVPLPLLAFIVHMKYSFFSVLAWLLYSSSGSSPGAGSPVVL